MTVLAFVCPKIIIFEETAVFKSGAIKETSGASVTNIESHSPILFCGVLFFKCLLIRQFLIM